MKEYVKDVMKRIRAIKLQFDQSPANMIVKIAGTE